MTRSHDRDLEPGRRRARARARGDLLDLLLGLLLGVLIGCSHASPQPATPPRTPTPGENVLALLPDGAQVIVELDLARLRANAAVGETAKQVLGALGADRPVPGLPVAVLGSPLASADRVVLAAYGVGTAQAATLTVLTTKAEVAGGVRISPELVALGPDDWVGQLQTRAALAAQHPLAVPEAVLKLRDHAMPAGATGAIVRITARLPFDARVALARMTNIDAAPAELSLWCDVADDLAIVVDSDAVDPGDHDARAANNSARRLAHTIRGVLGALAEAPVIRQLGVPTSLADARLVIEGSWVRTIVDVGPRHLARVVERARAMLAP
ncbi:MAG: hypothetical protein ABI467_12135 [Kofleriaceae bacterium]